MQVIWRLGPRGQGSEARARRLGTGGQGWGPGPKGQAKRLRNVRWYGWMKYPLHSVGHCPSGVAALLPNHCVRNCKS